MLCLPQEEQLTAIPEQDTTERIPECGSETDASLHLRDLTDDTGGALHTQLSAQPQACTAPQGDTDNPDGAASLPQNAGPWVESPALIVHPEDLAEEPGGSAPGNPTVIENERRKGSQQTAHGSWQTRFILAVAKQQICSPALSSGDAL